MLRVELTEGDVAEIEALVREVAARTDSVEDPAFLREATTYAQELPRNLRASLNAFRLRELDGVCVVAGEPIDDEGIGPTPAHWRDCKGSGSTLHEEIYFFLCACLLGDPIAWATQQDGHIMHDVLPIHGHEHEQLGSGSEEVLTWHTEDAFHPLRTDYIGLMCLRNPDGVETTYASVDDVQVDEELFAALSRPEFPIQPDRSHLPGNGTPERELPAEARLLLQRSYEWITKLDSEPEPIEVLFGDPEQPYLRLDPFFMSSPRAQDAREALATIVERIDGALMGYALRPGEIVFLDNYRAVHGRSAFKARFDGTDRWLKRLNIVRDLRRSRAARTSAESRVIY